MEKGVDSGLKNTTEIRQINVREIRFSRRHGGPIEGPLISPVHHNTIVLKGLRGALIGTQFHKQRPSLEWYLCVENAN